MNASTTDAWRRGASNASPRQVLEAVPAGRHAAHPVLAVDGLSVNISGPQGAVRALDRVSFHLHAGETLGMVGESGSGKSLTALALMGLLGPAAQVVGGRIVHEGRDLARAGAAAWQGVRGRHVALVFQSARRALHPIRPVGLQLMDVLRAHHRLTVKEARQRAVALLAEVDIAEPQARLAALPGELSGGMCQRVMIALALAGDPAVLIADEPTSSLDAPTRTVIVDLLADLAKRRGLATLFITHDLALAARRCDRIVVMHAGQLVETAPAARLLTRPAHPYTIRLVRAAPQLASSLDDLQPVPGALPDLAAAGLPACRFCDRCDRALPVCRTEVPVTRTLDSAAGHRVACWAVD